MSQNKETEEDVAVLKCPAAARVERSLGNAEVDLVYNAAPPIRRTRKSMSQHTR